VSIIVTCECGQRFETAEENAGRRARCPECGRELIIPKAADPLYEPPYHSVPREAETTSGGAIASLILGLTSIFCCLSVLTGLPAIILGVVGLNEMSASHGRVRGRGLAITGIVTGVIGCLLIVFPVLAVLLVRVSLPTALESAKSAADRARCANNLKQIGLALHNYELAEGHFPPAAITDEQGKPLLSWRVAILKYADPGLYERFHQDEPWDSPHNRALLSERPPFYRCPNNASLDNTLGNYQVLVGPGSVFELKEGARLADITDGVSNTIMVVETADPIPWTKPEELPFGPNELRLPFKTLHKNGFNVLMGDGSVRFLKEDIDPQTFRALVTRAGNEPVSPDNVVARP
jgi:prepilin-type processing-associated H-X9-DG protein